MITNQQNDREMKMKQYKTIKRIWSIFLTLSIVMAMGILSLPAYAAEGGSISVKYELNGVTITEPTQFELYKVGNFGRNEDGTVSIDLTSDFATSGVDLNGITPPAKDATQEQKDAWNNQWLQKAADMENWVKTAETKPAAAWTGTLASGSGYQTLTESGTAVHFSNGIYLLIGYEQKEGEYYWAPVPVLMMVLNGDIRFDIVDSESGNVVKTVKRPVVYKHVLHKTWDDRGHEKARPEKIDVDIYYGTASTEKIDTVTLSEDNDWTYIWYSQEAADNRIYTSKGVTTAVLNEGNDYTIPLPAGDGVWRVSEQQTADLDYYTVSVTQQTAGEATADAESTEYFNITNKYGTKRVRIRKHLINYLNHNDGQETYANATVAFDVKGYIGDSTAPSYHNQVGMTFTKPGNQEIVLDSIPVKVTRVVVEEIYSTNYKVVGQNPIEKDITREGDVVIETRTLEDGTTIDCPTFIFEFENDYDGPPKYGSGVVNTYGRNDNGGYSYKPNADTSEIYKPESQR